MEGDLIDRVRTHFRKGAPPPPPREQPLEVTHADGSIERKSSRVVLRRSAPEPEKPVAPPPPGAEEPRAPPPPRTGGPGPRGGGGPEGPGVSGGPAGAGGGGGNPRRAGD